MFGGAIDYLVILITSDIKTKIEIPSNAKLSGGFDGAKFYYHNSTNDGEKEIER